MTYGKEERQAYGRTYRAENREKCVERKRNWRHANAEHMRQYHRDRYAANRERILEQRKRGNTRKPEYATWVNMKQRCDNPAIRSYRWYGARGITVCARWRDSFENFLADMGQRPSPKHSIDRIDVNGNYEPNNCRWATKQEQIANMRPRISPQILPIAA
jgi:hypothetical protein